MAMLRLAPPSLPGLPTATSLPSVSGLRLPPVRVSPAVTRVLWMLRAVLWWLTLRLVVGAVCVGVLLAIAQLTVHTLLAYYVDIQPYTGS